MTFAPGLLEDRRVAITRTGVTAGTVDAQLRALGATIHPLPEAVLADDDAAAEWARAQAPLHALVVDAAARFGTGGGDALAATMNRVWRAARAVATGALIDAPAAGRLLFIAPRPDAGRHSPAVRAALENLARSLSVEWARFGITAVALWPGAATTDAEVAELVCFLVSAAGGYFSGCRFELGRAPVQAR